MADICPCCGQPKPEPKRPEVKIRDVLRVIEDRAGVAIEDIVSRKMGWEVKEWRKAGYAAARQATGSSYPKIARSFRRDHTTIIHGERRAEPWRVKALVKWVEERCYGA